MIRKRTIGLLLVAVLVVVSAVAATATIRVEVDGNPLQMAVKPVLVNGSTMVPMRAIFEALGAEVNWDSSTRIVVATKQDTTVQLGIGDRRALVNSQTVILDNSASIVNGSTMVPLRFVSEALGAEVRWNSAAQLVTIDTSTDRSEVNTGNGANTGSSQNDNNNSVIIQTIIPEGTVIPVSLDKQISSATNKVGDPVTVTVVSQANGDAEFPLGTKIRGIVQEASASANGEPGTLGLEFRQISLPSGKITSIDGSLVSLDSKSVEQASDGRLVARNKQDDPLKFIGMGAAGGFLLGKLTKHTLEGTLLGAAAGYLYSEKEKKRNQVADVTVAEDTKFGVRLDRQLSYNPTRNFFNARSNHLKNQSKVGSSGSQTITVVTGSQQVDFKNAQPYVDNGVVLVALQPVLDQAKIDYKYDSGTREVSLNTDSGPLSMEVGKPYATLGSEREPLEVAGQIKDGMVYVPLHFLALATGQNVVWNPDSGTVVLNNQ